MPDRSTMGSQLCEVPAGNPHIGLGGKVFRAGARHPPRPRRLGWVRVCGGETSDHLHLSAASGAVLEFPTFVMAFFTSVCVTRLLSSVLNLAFFASGDRLRSSFDPAQLSVREIPSDRTVQASRHIRETAVLRAKLVRPILTCSFSEHVGTFSRLS